MRWRAPSGRIHPVILFFVALGFSSSAFLYTLSILLDPKNLLVYHLPTNVSALFVPVIADVLCVAGAIFVFFATLPPRSLACRIAWRLIFSFYPWIVIRNASHLYDLPFTHAASIAILIFCTAVFLFSFRSLGKHNTFSPFDKVALLIVISAGLTGVFALVDAAAVMIAARHLNDSRVADTVPRSTSTPPNHRVVWIVLDELAFRQVYEHRLPGLQLPAFDKFRSQATIFSNVRPAGIRTEIVLPALMTGDAVDSIRSTIDGKLVVHDARGWHAFNQRDTVFSDADALGYRTAVVGWFNPYCRILSDVLDSCFWTNHSLLEGLPTDHGILLDTIEPLGDFAQRVPRYFGIASGRPRPEIAWGREHIRDYVELFRAADSALADSRNTFVFLHMPVPHPTGIWDRHSAQFAIDRSSYVDNLALADIYLAHVQHFLEARGQWANATIVIMGDHSWRTQLIWEDGPGWGHDDQLASDGGQFDPRPVYMVKLPGQSAPFTIQSAFPALRTRALLDRLLGGNIADPSQLRLWVQGELQDRHPAGA